MSFDARKAVQTWAAAAAFLSEGIWAADVERRGWARLGVACLRFAARVREGFSRDAVLVRASALTYFTILSIVPLLAIVSAVVTAVGVTENVVGAIIDQIAQVSPQAAERIQSFVENANIAGLGTLGAVSLFVTTILGIGTIERTLNQIFGATEARTLARRLADFMAVLFVGPLLLGAALSLAATAKSQWAVQRLLEFPLFARAYDLGLGELPVLLLALAFAFLYWFMPNTRVRPLAAALGGALAALVVNTALGFYVGLSVGVARANALYGSFAQLPLFFVWIYFFWVIVLFGAESTCAWQELAAGAPGRRSGIASHAQREQIGLRMAVEIGRAFRDACGPCTAGSLARALGVSEASALALAADLQSAGIACAVQHPAAEPAFQLGRPAELILVTDVLAVLRGPPPEPSRGETRSPDAVDALLDALRQGERDAAAGTSLAQLL